MRRSVMWSAFALATVFAVVFVVRFAEPFGPDQGLFACAARFIPRGALPYRDLYDSKPPLFLYAFALVGLIPLELHRAMWVFEGAFLVATFAVGYRFVATRWGRAAGVATAALLFVGMWAPGFGGFWSRAQAEELLALPMLLSASAAFSAGPRARRAFVAGALLGVCGLFKVPALAVAPAWVVAFAGAARGRALLGRVGLLAAGVATPWALTFAWFSAHGATRHFVSAVFVHGRAYAETIAVPWPLVATRLATTLSSVAALPMTAAALGIWLLARRRAPETAALVAWMVAALGAIASQRQLAGYHYLLVVPPLAICGGVGVAVVARALRRRGRVRLVSWVAAALLLSLGVHAGVAFARGYAPGALHLVGRTTRAGYLRDIQTGAFSPIIEEAIAARVARRTRPDERVLVWALSPGIYALADRAPSTRFVFHKVLLTDAALSRAIPGLDERRQELLRSIATHPPAMIIVAHGDENAFDPIDSRSSLSQVPALAELLNRDYVVDEHVNRFTLHRRR